MVRSKPLPPRSESVLGAHKQAVWKYRYACTMQVDDMHGGIPSDPNVRRGWLMSRLAPEGEKEAARNQRLVELIRQAEEEMAKSSDEAADAININGFVRDGEGHLYFEARCVKAAFREWFGVALGGGHLNARGWGATNKGLSSFIAEHVMVPGDLFPLLDMDGNHYSDPDEIEQRFVSTWRGQGISYAERLDRAILQFEVWSDWDFDEDIWLTVLALGEEQGIGSMRSQGSGRFVLTRWDPIDPPKSAAAKPVKKAPARKSA